MALLSFVVPPSWKLALMLLAIYNVDPSTAIKCTKVALEQLEADVDLKLNDIKVSLGILYIFQCSPLVRSNVDEGGSMKSIQCNLFKVSSSPRDCKCLVTGVSKVPARRQSKERGGE